MADVFLIGPISKSVGAVGKPLAARCLTRKMGWYPLFLSKPPCSLEIMLHAVHQAHLLQHAPRLSARDLARSSSGQPAVWLVFLRDAHLQHLLPHQCGLGHGQADCIQPRGQRLDSTRFSSSHQIHRGDHRDSVGFGFQQVANRRRHVSRLVRLNTG